MGELFQGLSRPGENYSSPSSTPFSSKGVVIEGRRSEVNVLFYSLKAKRCYTIKILKNLEQQIGELSTAFQGNRSP